MIIEIALGIVLAVVILALLPYIVMLTAVAVAGALALVAIGLAVWVLWDPAIAIGLATLVGVAVVLYGVARLLNQKWRHLDIDGLMSFLFFGGLLVVASFVVLAEYEVYSQYPISIIVVGLADLGLVVSIINWNKERLIEWNQRNAVAASYRKASQD